MHHAVYCTKSWLQRGQSVADIISSVWLNFAPLLMNSIKDSCYAPGGFWHLLTKTWPEMSAKFRDALVAKLCKLSDICCRLWHSNMKILQCTFSHTSMLNCVSLLTEAAFTLLLYWELLHWEDRPLRDFLHYPCQSEWQRKENLSRKILHYFNKGKVRQPWAWAHWQWNLKFAGLKHNKRRLDETRTCLPNLANSWTLGC